ncbi:alkaline shock response membrane anchor protein AmaP [Bailinhaonella thermotolerans]|uniref:Alkaline shock response membrane anchor protein AmaP n=1 Tax=Bailinhaonella thermotolerans TaxID=1070861 RepID=A0A3A4AZU7_9ACTN|nr:alkaline shock response membrane anchor protein AmaP [Bailinhaonella thermotolerans]RJL33188.1 alkaline shock response membrane anchor protein AmaP [Bailinhaonella thermotolerans]
MNRHKSHINRTALTLVGLVLLAAGALALAKALGAFGRRTGHLMTPAMERFAAQHQWFWWAVAAGLLVLVVLGLSWLLAQGGSDRVRGGLHLADGPDGVTRMNAGAATDAVTSELKALPGVQDAHTTLAGTPDKPYLRVNVTIDESTDVASFRTRLRNHVIARLRTALELDHLQSLVRLRLANTPKPRDLA